MSLILFYESSKNRNYFHVDSSRVNEKISNLNSGERLEEFHPKLGIDLSKVFKLYALINSNTSLDE